MTAVIARASQRRVSRVRQSALGTTAAGSDAARTVRRSTTSLNLTRAAYASNEKRTDQQKADSGLGTHQVSGNLEGESFLGAWDDFQESLLGLNYAATATITASSGDGFTIVGSTGVLTRAAGASQSFLTGGVRKGMIVKLTAFHASVDGKLAYVSAVTATTVTLKFLDGTTATDVAVADENATLVIPGKRSYIPSSGGTEHYYTVEDYFANMAVDAATVYSNVFVDAGTLTIQPNSFVGWSFGLIGTGETADYSGGSAPYLSNVAAVGTERAFRASSIWLIIDGAVIGTLTNGTLDIKRNSTAPAVAGSNYSPAVIPGMYDVQLSNVTVFLEDLSYRAKLRNETEYDATIVMQGTGTSDFFAVHLPRLKLTSHSIDDGDTGLQQTFAADALKAVAGTGVLETSVAFQDSSLS